MTKSKLFLPLLLTVVLAAGIYLGGKMSSGPMRSPFMSSKQNQFNKLTQIINYIQQQYVDTIKEKTLVEESISAILTHLDPHSAYIPAEDLQASNEPLEGNFDGIGVEFHIQNDTIMVVTAISGGPSEQLGIRSGDRIVKIESKSVAGIDIANNDVMQKLRGPGGTKVHVSILRKGQRKLIEFTITRGKIPIYSVDAAFMVSPTAGYIKISRFAANTYDEYLQAFAKLKQQGMQSLIIDLRGNPGGYLNAATQLADEFLKDKELIVYTQGKARPKEAYYATSKGNFEQGKLIVLIDEGSASASEILAGAVQDLDRATIIGRRSFGKGLVQEQTVLPDGSALRLTIARYYTPSGRCIQKPYSAEDPELYSNEVYHRFKSGELGNKDSIKITDTLKYKTKSGRIVYGGGGIMPDIFVPLDTTGASNYFSELVSQGIIIQYAYDYVDQHRAQLNSYANFAAFNKAFNVNDALLQQLVNFAASKGIKKNEKGLKIASTIIRTQLKAYIARQVWNNDGFYPVVLQMDKGLKKALETLDQKGL